MERALRFTGEHDLDGYYIHVLGGRAGSGSSAATGRRRWPTPTRRSTSPALLGMNAVLPLVVRGRIQAARGDADAHGDPGRGRPARRRRRGRRDGRAGRRRAVRAVPLVRRRRARPGGGPSEPGRDPAVRHQRVPRRPAGLPALAGRRRRPGAGARGGAVPADDRRRLGRGRGRVGATRRHLPAGRGAGRRRRGRGRRGAAHPGRARCDQGRRVPPGRAAQTRHLAGAARSTPYDGGELRRSDRRARSTCSPCSSRGCRTPRSRPA